MNVSARILRTVNLHNPINRREIHASRTDIRREQDSLLLLHKLKVDGSPLVLVLLTVQFEKVLAAFE